MFGRFPRINDINTGNDHGDSSLNIWIVFIIPGRYSTEYVEVEFEYKGTKYKKKTRYNFAKDYKQGDTVNVCFLPDDPQMNIVIKSNESEKGANSFLAGGICIVGGVILAILLTYSFFIKGISL